MAIDATVGGANANSYVTIDRATAILTESRLRVSDWTDAPNGDEDREAALRWATSLIDTYFDFEGQRDVGAFLDEAETKLGWLDIRAHPLGVDSPSIRVTMYNPMGVAIIEQVRDFMHEFKGRHS